MEVLADCVGCLGNLGMTKSVYIIGLSSHDRN